MKAAVLNGFGGPEVFQILERPDLIPNSFEVLIEVKAAGVNRPDVFQRKGNYPAPAGVVSDIPGLEVSGVISSVGSEVKKFKIGDEVIALLAGGGYASQATAHESVCLHKPKNLTFEEAASLPETIFTVWHNLFERGKLVSTDHVLIHGGTGGIGSTAIQLAKLFGATVYTTVGSLEKAKIAKELGADLVINYKTEDFSEILMDKKVDLILDSIGGSYFNKHISLLREEGRLIQINATEGAKVELNLFKLMQKRIYLTGSTLRARDISFKAELADAIETNVLPIIEQGKYKTLLTKIFPLEQVIEAHHYFEDAESYGKIVLKINS